MPVTPAARDPWSAQTSKRGLACDELVSALQKYVRRGEAQECLLVAREMYETSEALADHLWDRLVTIAAADVWVGGQAPVVVETLRSQGLRKPWAAQHGWLYVAGAVRYLCESPKDMTTEDMCMWTYHVLAQGKRTPVVPDYALDNHTRRGQDLGRGVRHFLEGGCQVRHEQAGRNTWYREQVLGFVNSGQWVE